MNANPTVLDLTRRLIRLETINPPGHESECARFLGKLLEDSGFSCRIFEFAPGRSSLVAKLEGEGDRPPLCFAGHIDTVPLGARPWSYDPFAGEIADGKLYGRGSSDMKSGVAAYVVAGLSLARLSGRRAGLTIVAAAGEETGCEGTYDLASRRNVLGRAGALVVAEPSSNYPMLGHKGALWLCGKTTGVTAHGSMPEQGVNAIYAAARAVTRLEGYGFNVAPDPLLGSPTLNVGTFSAGMNINSVPDEASFTLDVCTIPGQDHACERDNLSRYLGDGVTLEALVDVAAISSASEDPWVQEVFEVMGQILGEQPKPRTLPFFTDGSALKPALGGPPTVILGPGETAMAHRTDEYCFVHRLEEAVAA